MTQLSDKLQRAPSDTTAYWCVTCGRCYLGRHGGSGEVLREGRGGHCTGYIDVGTPAECIEAFKASKAEAA